MKKQLIAFVAIAALAVCAAATAAAAGVPPATVFHAVASHFASPEMAMGLAGLGAAGITTFVEDGKVLQLDPAASVASGVGHLFGSALFGVAAVDAVSGTASSFITEGVVTIAKTSALAIAIGDRVFWDATNKEVNKTTSAQQQVGVAVEAVADPSPTVKIKLTPALPVAT